MTHKLETDYAQRRDLQLSGTQTREGDEFGPWISNTDTEVVLRAYRKWGLHAFEKLRGMFALAIWDAGKQELVLARDPFGIKPLYYYESGPGQNRIVFASEVRAVLASGFVPPKLSSEGVRSYLSCGSVQAPLTIVQGVRALLPGQYLRINAEQADSAALRIATATFQDASRVDPESEGSDSGCPRGGRGSVAGETGRVGEVTPCQRCPARSVFVRRNGFKRAGCLNE